jgi:hypothetical protein
MAKMPAALFALTALAVSGGARADSLADGETLVLHPDGKGGAKIAGRVKIEDWAVLFERP